jgi:hypothetical protein
MPTNMDMNDFYRGCGFVRGTSSEVADWNALDVGTSTDTTLVLSVGLFGYDLSCVAGLCAQLNNSDGGDGEEFDGYCGLIESRGLDGLAFGIYAAVPQTTLAGAYCAGFRNDEPGNRTGNSWTCHNDSRSVPTYYAYNDY